MKCTSFQWKSLCKISLDILYFKIHIHTTRMVVFNLHMDYKYPFVEKIGRKTRVKCINDGMNNVNEGAPKFYNILRDKKLQDNSFFTPPHPTQYQKSCSRFKNSTASLSHGFSFFILIHTRERCSSKVYQM